MSVYEGSNGRYYTENDLWERFESGAWTPRMWETDTGREIVETEAEEVLMLAPTDPVDLPEGVEIRRDGGFPTIVDSRELRTRSRGLLSR
ncbi:hypothetical protein [Halegenticoccus soli]|uniref:hypothetical protein n=1 Tax=Halegenticoccus soli TaxID=1985678 RepID=UPI0018EAC13F|nr:hypothetical protein [Halegenticoccus soli]